MSPTKKQESFSARTGCDASLRQRAEEQGGWRKRSARRAGQDVGAGPRPRQADSRDRQGERA